MCESFPRMWDQLELWALSFFTVRIIPTYVGSTDRRGKKTSGYSNHSHVCGINKAPKKKSYSTIESFPRMWDQPGFPVF